MGIYESTAKLLRNPSRLSRADAKHDKEQVKEFLARSQGEAAQLLLCALMIYCNAGYVPTYDYMKADLPAFYPTYDGIFRIIIRHPAKTSAEAVTSATSILIELTRWWNGVDEQPIFGSLHLEVIDDSAEPKEAAEILTVGTEKIARFPASKVLEDPFGQAEEVAFALDEIAGTVFNGYLSAGRLVELIMGP